VRLARDTWNRCLAICAVLAMVGLYAVFVIHYATDDECEVFVTGDVLDCFLCAKLAVMGIDFPVETVLPDPPVINLLPMPVALITVMRVSVRETGARSPPGRPI